MTIDHLSSDRIDEIALSLDLDVYGANGDWSETEIRDRLIAKVHESTGWQFYESDTIPVYAVASLLFLMWTYMDREQMNLLAKMNGGGQGPRPRRAPPLHLVP